MVLFSTRKKRISFSSKLCNIFSVSLTRLKLFFLSYSNQSRERTYASMRGLSARYLFSLLQKTEKEIKKLTTCLRISSGTFLEWLQSADAAEWLNITGARDTANVSRIVGTLTWARSTIIPSRFISKTTNWNTPEAAQRSTTLPLMPRIWHARD